MSCNPGFLERPGFPACAHHISFRKVQAEIKDSALYASSSNPDLIFAITIRGHVIVFILLARSNRLVLFFNRSEFYWYPFSCGLPWKPNVALVLQCSPADMCLPDAHPGEPTSQNLLNAFVVVPLTLFNPPHKNF